MAGIVGSSSADLTVNKPSKSEVKLNINKIFIYDE